MKRIVEMAFICAAMVAVWPSVCSAQTAPSAANSEAPQSVAPEPVVTRDCPDCPELVRVGGVGDGGKPLFVGRYELLWHEYYQSVAEAGCPPPANLDGTVLDYDPGREDRYPITSIKPIYIECYLNWLRDKTGKTYRLPYEREWMRIAVASGVTASDTVANYPGAKAFLRNEFESIPSKFLDRTERREVVKRSVIGPVGLKPVDKLGLYDLIGNLEEMIGDLPEGAKSSSHGMRVRTIKGGGLDSWRGDFNLITDYRYGFIDHYTFIVGYRVVREE